MDFFSRSLCILTVLVCTCLLVVPRGASADALAGKGEWQSSSGATMRGAWSVTLAQSGTSLEGDITLSGSPFFTGGEVTGTLDGDEVMLGVLTDGQYQATFGGKLVEGKISGEWDFPAIGDRGVWSGTLLSVE
jgi:hypothetical protein